MNILIACEESQRVCLEFRKRGHNAFSCDIVDCSGGHPEYHIKGDVLPLLNGNVSFKTCDGSTHNIKGAWDMIIAHPPCTYLTVTGNRWFDVEKYGVKAIKRLHDRQLAVEFFERFTNLNCEKVAIENPIGVMSTYYRKPDQIIHPYMFGDPERKATCLWLKGLPKLKATNIVKPNIITFKNGTGTMSKFYMEALKLPAEERAKERSKTFPGIAKAIAEQWGNL